MASAAFQCMRVLKLTPHNHLPDPTQLTHWTVKSFFKAFDRGTTNNSTLNFISQDFSYLLLCHTWPRVTRIRRPGSRAACRPLGRLRWRSRRRKRSPTLHCKTLPPCPHSVSSCRRLDVAGWQARQTLTGLSTAATCTRRVARGRGWNPSAAWCRRGEKDLWRDIREKKFGIKLCNLVAYCHNMVGI